MEGSQPLKRDTTWWQSSSNETLNGIGIPRQTLQTNFDVTSRLGTTDPAAPHRWSASAPGPEPGPSAAAARAGPHPLRPRILPAGLHVCAPTPLQRPVRRLLRLHVSRAAGYEN